MKRNILIVCLVIVLAFCFGALFACADLNVEEPETVDEALALREKIPELLSRQTVLKEITVDESSGTIACTVATDVSSVDLSALNLTDGTITVYADEARTNAVTTIAITENERVFYLSIVKGDISINYTVILTRKATSTDPTDNPPSSHSHTFSDAWSSDKDYHWHAATCEHTTEIKDKAVHVWNAGEITTPATEEAEGERTYTCTVCGAKKNESIAKLKKTSEGLSFTLQNDDTYQVIGPGVCTDTDLIIPAVYNEKRVTSIGDHAFYGCTGLTSVTIPDSVTSIWSSAFNNCSGLTLVTIPDSVTSIGSYAFQSCSNLTSVTIGSGVTSIGNYAFRGCSGLKSVTIPDSVTSIGKSAFEYCSGLTSINVAEGNSVYHSAGNCLIKTNDKMLIVGCKTSVIPDDGSVTSIGDYAFYGSGLTSITIPDSVTSIGWVAFYGCTGLTSVTIPDSVTSIGDGAFYDCSGLTSVTIPDSVTSIGNYAFYDCSGLTSIHYEGTRGQWNAISKGSSWDYDTGNYTVYCTDGNVTK